MPPKAKEYKIEYKSPEADTREQLKAYVSQKYERDGEMRV